jgi:hypothetical protein
MSLTKSALLALAVLSAAAPAVAGDFGAAKTTVCHRTGQKAVDGLFRGHLITVSNNAVAAHRGHGDAVVRPEWLNRFPSGNCKLDAAGKLYDDQGRPVPGESPPPPDVG